MSETWYSRNRERALENNRQWRAKNKEKVREDARRRYAANSDHFRKRARQWLRDHPEYVREKDRASIESGYNRVKCAARWAHPVRQTCEVDGCDQLGERHHDDYDKPKEIRWLCHWHHMEEHREEGGRNNTPESL